MNAPQSLSLAVVAVLGLGVTLLGHGGTPLDPLIDRAARGDHGAELELGQAYLDGRGVTIDVTRGLDLLERAAAADLPVAHYLLARHAEAGPPSLTRRERMLRHYRRAAELGHTTAQARLGELLLDRADDTRIDADDRSRLRTQAEMLLVHAADAGNGYAELRLAELSRDGAFGERDPARVLDYFRRAEQHGQPRAAWALARHDLDATGSEGDADEGIRHLARAADGGETRATLELVRRYLDGDGLPDDPDKARAWLTLAERQGAAGIDALRARIDARAAARSAALDAVGPRAAIEATTVAESSRDADPAKARAEAAPHCAIVVDRTPEVVQLEATIERLERHAADLAAERARLEARLAAADARSAALDTALGEPAAERGLGLAAVERRDYGDALTHLRRAVAGDDPVALASLGTLLLRGRGAPADPPRALDFLVRAAGLGDSLAARNLAYVYLHGIGVPADAAAAERWLALAAERGDGDARRQLAATAGGAAAAVVVR